MIKTYYLWHNDCYGSESFGWYAVVWGAHKKAMFTSERDAEIWASEIEKRGYRKVDSKASSEAGSDHE